MMEQEIQDVVRSSIKDLPLYSTIKQELKEQFESHEPNRSELINYIRDNNLSKGIIDVIDKKLTQSIKKSQEVMQIIRVPKVIIPEEFKELTIKILEGNDFWEYTNKPIEKMLMLDISFMNQRHITNAINSSSNPRFNEVCSFSLFKDIKINIRQLMTSNNPLHLALIEYNTATNKKKVISVKRVQWRNVAYNKAIEQELTFYSNNRQIKSAVGKLKLQMHFNNETNLTFISGEVKDPEDSLSVKRLFDEYVKEWYDDYKQIREEHKAREVPIYVETDDALYS